MPQRKKMEIPSKEPEISSTTHEEEEEMQHDISKLQDQAQQISLSQKVTEAKMNGMEANMNGVQVKMDGMEAKINGMDAKMEELKINLNKLLQEMVTNGKKVVEENHDENKSNFNHDFIESNIGFKNHHIPKVDMRKFDGKDPLNWILQMEQYFDLHEVQLLQKVHIPSCIH